MARDYYLILGVDPDATFEQIRSAYRRKAKQLHPDHYPGSSEPFRDVQEAYEALSDPERRACYDAEQGRARRAREEPLRSRAVPVEPLIPRQRVSGWGREPVGPSRASPVAERIDGLWDELDGMFGAWGREEEQVVIPLTREQARLGGRVRIWIALEARCPSCGGFGRLGFYGCRECAGQGTIVEQRPVWIAFPPGVSDQTVARVSLAPLDAPDAGLTVRFRVRG